MRPVVFPYRLFGGVLCPFIEFGIKGVSGEWVKADAYVDSGAFLSVFSIRDAERLGLRLTAGDLIYASGVDGKSIPVYVHRMPVQIGPHKFQAHMGFSEKLGSGFNLLGREDFFSRFDVTFSDTSRRLMFQPIKGKPKAGGKSIVALMKARRKRKAY